MLEMFIKILETATKVEDKISGQTMGYMITTEAFDIIQSHVNFLSSQKDMEPETKKLLYDHVEDLYMD